MSLLTSDCSELDKARYLLFNSHSCFRCSSVGSGSAIRERLTNQTERPSKLLASKRTDAQRQFDPVPG